jgi:hypothetical protein
MSNKYGLPEDQLDRIRARDTRCVYCEKEMRAPIKGTPATDWATIEHLNRFPPFDDATTVAICCMSCNASRGAKKITDWFESDYCQKRDVNFSSVAEPVREYLRRGELEISAGGT